MARTDYELNKPRTAASMAALIARDEQFRSFAFALQFIEGGTTSGTGATIATVPMFLPDHAAGHLLWGYIDVKGTNGETGAWRMSIGATVGSWSSTFTSTGAYILSPYANVATPAASADDYVDVLIQMKTSSSLVYGKNDTPNMTFWFDSP
jgi:hypothetical protein